MKNTHTNNTHNKKKKKITRLCNNHGGNIEIRVPFYLDIINAFFSFLPVYCKRLCKKRERKKIEKKQTAAYKTMIFETIIEEKCSKTRFDEKKKNKLFTNTLHVTK